MSQALKIDLMSQQKLSGRKFESGKGGVPAAVKAGGCEAHLNLTKVLKEFVLGSLNFSVRILQPRGKETSAKPLRVTLGDAQLAICDVGN